jgi:hypothetical protein
MRRTSKRSFLAKKQHNTLQGPVAVAMLCVLPLSKPVQPRSHVNEILRMQYAIHGAPSSRLMEQEVLGRTSFRLFYNRRSVSQSVSVSGPWPDFYYYPTSVHLLMWGVLSDERFNTSKPRPCCNSGGFEPGSGHVGFVVAKVALGEVFSEYFGFPCQALHRLFHTHHHLGLLQYGLSSGHGSTPPSKSQ